MTPEPRPPGAAIGIDVAEHGHGVQFYDRDESLVGAVCRFFAAGLAVDEPAIAIATPEHLAAIRSALIHAGVDVTLEEAQGRITFLDARLTLAQFMVDGMPDASRMVPLITSVLDRAGQSSLCGSVRAFGEMVDLLWRDGNPKAAIRLEDLWNGLRQTRSFALLCGYSMANFHSASHGEDFRSICDAHACVLPTESFAGLADPAATQREVALLQQRARALEHEIARRTHMERTLQEMTKDLASLLERERIARADAESASRAKDEFLAMLGHELRNPLAPIVTALELRHLRGETQGSMEWAIIDRQARHLVRLVDDLLDVSRITRGKVTLEKERVHVGSAFAKALEMTRPLLETKRHQLTVDVPDDLAVDADATRLAQIVANLLSNAAKYTESPGKIALSASRENGHVVLRVRDSGVGIAPDMLPRVFDLFVQERQSLDRSHGGLGLGLAIVRNLVALHGGTVDASSPGKGQGSEFTVRLPALGSAADAALSAPVSPEDRCDAGAAPCRILVVDDNQDAAVLLATSLQALGHTVRVAHDGGAALRELQSFRPDVALLDIGLPGMDGYELTRVLRRRPDLRRLCIVAVSGYGQDVDRKNSAAAGFDHHLVKPVSLRAIESLLPRRA